MASSTSSSIQRLSSDTSRLLSATTIIVSPPVVLKELFDNAVDSGATTIEVGLTSDTLGKITVKDDGQGIAEEDFDHLGRRSHTSKLRCFEDLQAKGGSTLGFRGEALASMASMGDLTITTRTAHATVASLLKIKPEGGILSKQNTHGPVGTTVVLANLFRNMPVRHKAGKRDADKSLRAIKKLLHSYILARPQVKVVFKLLDASKGHWAYNPGRAATTREAVLQLFGRPLASSCVQRIYRPSGDNADSGSDDSDSDSDSECEAPTNVLDKMVFEAFWPRADANGERVAKHGAFISVDSRPISAAHGVGSKIYDTFRRAWRESLGSVARDLHAPFMQINVKCPPGSYDPNVDPLKEQLIFENEAELIYKVEKFCEKAYPRLETPKQDEECQMDSRPSTAWSCHPSGQAALGHIAQEHATPEAQPEIIPHAHYSDQTRGLVVLSTDIEPAGPPSSSSPPDSIFDMTEQDENDLKLASDEVELALKNNGHSPIKQQVPGAEDVAGCRSADDISLHTTTARTKFVVDMSRTRTASDQEDHGLQEVQVALTAQDLRAFLEEGSDVENETTMPSAPMMVMPLGTGETNGMDMTRQSGQVVSTNTPLSPGLFVSQGEARVAPPSKLVAARGQATLGAEFPPTLTQRRARPRNERPRERTKHPNRDRQAGGLAKRLKLSMNTPGGGNIFGHEYTYGGEHAVGDNHIIGSQRAVGNKHDVAGDRAYAVQQHAYAAGSFHDGPQAPTNSGMVQSGHATTLDGYKRGAAANNQPPTCSFKQLVGQYHSGANDNIYVPSATGPATDEEQESRNLVQELTVDMGALALAVREASDPYARGGEFMTGIAEEDKVGLAPFVQERLVVLLSEYAVKIGIEELDLEFSLFAPGEE